MYIYISLLSYTLGKDIHLVFSLEFLCYFQWYLLNKYDIFSSISYSNPWQPFSFFLYLLALYFYSTLFLTYHSGRCVATNQRTLRTSRHPGSSTSRDLLPEPFPFARHSTRDVHRRCPRVSKVFPAPLLSQTCTNPSVFPGCKKTPPFPFRGLLTSF